MSLYPKRPGWPRRPPRRFRLGSTSRKGYTRKDGTYVSPAGASPPLDSWQKKLHNKTMPMPEPPRSPILRRRQKALRNLQRQYRLLHGLERGRRNRYGRLKTPVQRWQDWQRAHQKVALGVLQPFQPANQNQLQAPPSGPPNPN